jgi:cytochrome c oxidase cbb3-type subunit III
MTRRLTVVVLALMVSGRLVAEAKEPEGKALFEKNCAMCHGSDGHARPVIKNSKVHDFDDGAWQKSISDAEIRKTITEGRPGTLMQPWGKRFTPPETDALVAYVRSFAPSK